MDNLVLQNTLCSSD